MLKALHIENMAVIERADMEPGPGFNVLTGETGAGKSIIIDALGAALGGRIKSGIVRSGAGKALVTAEFSADGTEDWCREHDVEPEDDSLFITRSVTSDGKSSCRINGAPMPVSALKELGECLLDIHGQTDGQRMADEKYHIGYLDGYAGLSGELDDYRKEYDAYIAARRKLNALMTDESEKERRRDLLKFQIEEIERANLTPGESEALTARREMLKNAARITDGVEGAYTSLYGGERSDGAIALISQASGELSGAAKWSEELSELTGRLNGLEAEAEDIAEALRDFRRGLDFSPNELDDTENRLSQIRRLSRKYGENEEKILEYLEACREELDGIDNSEELERRLKAETEKLLGQAEKAAAGLSEKRKKAAQKLREEITAQLKELSMPGASFDVEIEETDLGKTGRDGVRFLIAANAGEAPGRISKVASGGELSRIMLAMKTVLTGADDIGAMVFDEIDTGVSGVAASRVAEKLSRLAKDKQVICVTHLPQITAMADTHFRISKSVSNGRTYTSVEELDPRERAEEIARLTGGDRATDTTLLAAKELLSAAESFKKGASHG